MLWHGFILYLKIQKCTEIYRLHKIGILNISFAGNSIYTHPADSSRKYMSYLNQFFIVITDLFSYPQY